ncbi:plasmid stabilization protein [Streptomyces sp. NPDC052225]|uniref:plasmid stabilization protein n=1 Tax=Streptomyces sp. NPDC052225 TaxID=3154949 RepID=UPI003412CFC3
MPSGSNAERERPYEKDKQSALLPRREHRPCRADRRAPVARTDHRWNEERARSGAAKPAGRTSTRDISSGRRGGLRSRHGAGVPPRDQLYEEAKGRVIKDRSSMTKSARAKPPGH